MFQCETIIWRKYNTQQLIKNQVLSSEKTYRRKANELVLSLRLEKILTKDEIVYTYLNVVPLDEIIMALTSQVSHLHRIVYLVSHHLNLILQNLHT